MTQVNSKSLAQPPAVLLDPRYGRFKRMAAGFILGALSADVFCQLQFDASSHHVVLAAAIVGALLGLTRSGSLALSLMGLLAALTLLVIGYTPLVPSLVAQREWPSDSVVPSEAVVVLGAGVLSDGTLSAHSRDRLLHALALLRSGYGRRLVLPLARRSWSPAVRTQMRELGLEFPIEEVGPVATTHDEALAVADWAHKRGLQQVILVTNASHMARARAAFVRAGLHVLRSSCGDSNCDMYNPVTLADRTRALSTWLHEAIGYQLYRWRGWI